jgi:hypothetical protein
LRSSWRRAWKLCQKARNGVTPVPALDHNRHSNEHRIEHGSAFQC